MNIGGHSVDASFYIVDGEVPMLLGNDLLEPLKAKIDISNPLLEIQKLKSSIPMVRTSGGHYVIPLKEFVQTDDKSIVEGENKSENVIDDEADMVMAVLFPKLSDEDQLQKLHDEVGHEVFLNIALNDFKKS